MKERYIVLLVVIVFLLSGLTGCKPKVERFHEEPATFWDGIWHGLNFFELPGAYQSTSGYIWGVRIGITWIILSCLVCYISGVIWVIKTEGDLLAILMCYSGPMIGFLLGALIYWSIYGLVAAIAWLFECVGLFWKWLWSH